MLASLSIVAYQERSVTMNKSESGGLRASSISKLVHSSLELALGKDYKRRVKIYEDIPKGLLRNGHLTLAPGSTQQLKIYGDLTDREISVITKELSNSLRQTRDATYVPVVIEFYRVEVFDLREGGGRSRGKEELLRREVFSGSPR